jgi:hypothetical protein
MSGGQHPAAMEDKNPRRGFDFGSACAGGYEPNSSRARAIAAACQGADGPAGN